MAYAIQGLSKPRDSYLLLFGEKEEKVRDNYERRTPIHTPTDLERVHFGGLLNTAIMVTPSTLLRDHRDEQGIYMGLMAARAMAVAHTIPEWRHFVEETESVYPRLWDYMLNPPKSETDDEFTVTPFVEALLAGTKPEDMSPEDLQSVESFLNIVGDDPDVELEQEILNKGMSAVFNIQTSHAGDPYVFSVPAFAAGLHALGMKVPQDVLDHVLLHDWRHKIGLEKMLGDSDILQMMFGDSHAYLHRVKLWVKRDVANPEKPGMYPLPFFPV